MGPNSSISHPFFYPRTGEEDQTSHREAVLGNPRAESLVLPMGNGLLRSDPNSLLASEQENNFFLLLQQILTEQGDTTSHCRALARQRREKGWGYGRYPCSRALGGHQIPPCEEQTAPVSSHKWEHCWHEHLSRAGLLSGWTQQG